MDKYERDGLLKTFLDKWGIDAQSMMCIEEMSELTKELCKYRRLKYTEGGTDLDKRRQENISHIQEEIADVYNMLDQMKIYFGASNIDEIIEQKLIRTKKPYRREIDRC